MSENCTHDCSTCGENCPSRQDPNSLLAPMNKMSKVKKVIGVVSGKGGVGKSLVTSMMAVTMQRRDQKTAILDADITGPSIPKCFGIHERAQGCEDGLFRIFIGEREPEGLDAPLYLQENDTITIIRLVMLTGGYF